MFRIYQHYYNKSLRIRSNKFKRSLPRCDIGYETPWPTAVLLKSALDDRIAGSARADHGRPSASDLD
jgi:hypothetical protein